jgi:hypothetical protein
MFLAGAALVRRDGFERSASSAAPWTEDSADDGRCDAAEERDAAASPAEVGGSR